MKKSTVIGICGFFGAALILLAGCRSDQFYHSRAADEAREFLLKNSPELTADQVCFVRYNDPVLLKGDGLGEPEKLGGRETSKGYIRQICVAWEIPGRDDIYMVCGFSEERMQYWKPNRLIRKKFQRKAQAQDEMLSSARKYLLNNLAANLTTEEINRVRFTYPVLAETDFEVNFNTDLKMDAEKAAQSKAAAEKNRQYSLLWAIGDRYVVFAGYSSPELTGWRILFAGVLPADEVTKHTLHVVKNPENFNTSLIQEIK